MNRIKLTLAAALLMVLTLPVGFARAQGWKEMNYGQFKQATIEAQWDKKNIAYKGIAIKVGKAADNATVLFDTEMMRYVAGWTGGFLNGEGVSFNGSHGTSPGPAGKQRWGVEPGPGVAKITGTEADWKDPRKTPDGPLPRDWAQYKGLYLIEDQTILHYSVGKTLIYDMPWYEKVEGVDLFHRNLLVLANAANAEIRMVLADAHGKPGKAELAAPNLVKFDGSDKSGGDPTGISVRGDMDGVTLEAQDGRAILVIKPFRKARTLRITTAVGPKGPEAAAIAAKLNLPLADLRESLRGGPARWNKVIETKGKLGTGKEAYVVDTIEVPLKNPWNSWMRIAGLSFFKDGKRAAVSTWSGDVWLVSGIDEKLDKVTWKRYATGLFDALGVCVVKDTVYVLGRDQITKLHDYNDDDEADYYECFNNDIAVTRNFHEFAYDLQMAPDGWFYFVKGGPVRGGGSGFERISEHAGCVLRVSADGTKFEVYATGLRAPNGMGVGPKGEITTGDNEGTWVPKCKINWVKKGGFLGVVDLAHRESDKPATYDPVICWLPKGQDNSGGGQTWVTSDQWGPFKGDLLHTSYGTSTLFKVMKEEVDGVIQGGVVKFNTAFQSGICRPRFNPVDGQLYIVGLRGWQTNAKADGSLERVRFTGKPANMPTALNVLADGVKITFTDALDVKTAADVKNFAVKQWNYKWTSGYGSDDFSVATGAKGQDTVKVDAVQISEDGKSITLKMAVKPVMQMEIRFRVTAADGTKLNQTIYNTINKVPGGK